MTNGKVGKNLLTPAKNRLHLVGSLELFNKLPHACKHVKSSVIVRFCKMNTLCVVKYDGHTFACHACKSIPLLCAYLCVSVHDPRISDMHCRPQVSRPVFDGTSTVQWVPLVHCLLGLSVSVSSVGTEWRSVSVSSTCMAQLHCTLHAVDTNTAAVRHIW